MSLQTRAVSLAIVVATVLALSTTEWSVAQSRTDPALSLLSAAERRARDGDLAGALTDYQQLVRQFPQSAQAPEAMLRIARGRLTQDDRAAALEAVTQLVTTYPGAPQAAGGLLLEGRIRADRPESPDDLLGARKTLEKTWLLFPRSVFPTLDARSSARVLDGQLALRLGEDDEALTSFLNALELEPLSSATADAHIGLATALVRAGDWLAATESLQQAVASSASPAESRALARRRIALVERRLVRPALGAPLWQTARRMVVAGTELKRLAGVAANDAGRLLLIDSGNDEMLLVSPQGAREQRWTVRNAERVSWYRDQTPQVANRDSVIVPGESAQQFVLPTRGKPLDGIRAAERTPFGSWLVLASKSDGVMSYRDDGRDGASILSGDGDPVDLSVDSLDRLYVLERKNRRVLRIEPGDASREPVVAGGWKRPVAITVDAFGFLHVLDQDSNRIYTYDRGGQQIGVVGPTLPGGLELRRPEDLAAGGDGRLYIADSRSGLMVLE